MDNLAHVGKYNMKAEELSVKCPKCGCKDKHIIKENEPMGTTTCAGPILSGNKAPDGTKYRCSECGYKFK